MLVAALAYQGIAAPLAVRTWQQNVTLEPDAYWLVRTDTVRDAVTALPACPRHGRGGARVLLRSLCRADGVAGHWLAAATQTPTAPALRRRSDRGRRDVCRAAARHDDHQRLASGVPGPR